MMAVTINQARKGEKLIDKRNIETHEKDNW